jgi:hypothetical protein
VRGLVADLRFFALAGVDVGEGANHAQRPAEAVAFGHRGARQDPAPLPVAAADAVLDRVVGRPAGEVLGQRVAHARHVVFVHQFLQAGCIETHGVAFAVEDCLRAWRQRGHAGDEVAE